MKITEQWQGLGSIPLQPHNHELMEYTVLENTVRSKNHNY